MKLENSVIFIGMMGSGKTTIGKALSKEWQLPFYDIDEVVEQTEDKTIREIFEHEGESAFRHAEHLALKEVMTWKTGIIATGGGIVTRRENRDLLVEAPMVIYLKASHETILEHLRSEREHRPLLDGQWEERLQDLLMHRQSFYEAVSSYVIDVDNMSVSDVIKEIQLLNNKYLWYDEGD